MNRILMIDLDLPLTDRLTSPLWRTGFRADRTADTVAAERMLATRRYDLLVIRSKDVRPALDWLEDTTAPRTILLTQDANEPMVRRAMRDGTIQRHLLTPVYFRVLRAAIAEQLRPTRIEQTFDNYPRKAGGVVM